LNIYSKEPDDNSGISIPDILIVTWQVAQVGVNLPTYNYVINYHIPKVPGNLEQRYGRIDRLNSKCKDLYNIYHLDKTPSTQVYRANLIYALYEYYDGIVDTPHNLPVKNLLICKGLQLKEINCDDLYQSLATYICYYYSVTKDTDKLKKSVLSTCKNTIAIKSIDDNKCMLEIKEKLVECSIEEIQIFDEINVNKTQQKESEISQEEEYTKKIKSIINYINYYEDINTMRKTLNKAEIDAAGTIIFWNKKSQDQKITLNCNDIVKKIVKYRWNRRKQEISQQKGIS
jgi:hypothetical protein